MTPSPETAPVAVAVVSWNTRDLLASCLRSLASDAEAGRAEVWVVDNGSADGSPDMVAADFPWVRLELPGENLGFGAAVNRVAAATSTPWVAPANADVELTPGALATLLSAGDAHPRAGVIGPRLILPGGRVQPAAGRFPGLGDSLLLHSRLYKVRPSLGEQRYLTGYWDPLRPRVVEWLTGAFLLVRRAAWDAVGGFDEEQWMYAEDLDLGWRVARAGWESRYEPAAVVHHHHSASAVQAFGTEDDVQQRWMASTYAWMLRRRGPLQTRATAALNVADAGLRAGVLAALARRDPTRWEERLRLARRDVGQHRQGLRGRADLLAPR